MTPRNPAMEQADRTPAPWASVMKVPILMFVVNAAEGMWDNDPQSLLDGDGGGSIGEADVRLAVLLGMDEERIDVLRIPADYRDPIIRMSIRPRPRYLRDGNPPAVSPLPHATYRVQRASARLALDPHTVSSEGLSLPYDTATHQTRVVVQRYRRRL